MVVAHSFPFLPFLHRYVLLVLYTTILSQELVPDFVCEPLLQKLYTVRWLFPQLLKALLPVAIRFITRLQYPLLTGCTVVQSLLHTV